MMLCWEYVVLGRLFGDPCGVCGGLPLAFITSSFDIELVHSHLILTMARALTALDKTFV